MGRGRVRWRSDGEREGEMEELWGEGGVMVRESVRGRSYGEREGEMEELWEREGERDE